jgi:hypothetical protein
MRLRGTVRPHVTQPKGSAVSLTASNGNHHAALLQAAFRCAAASPMAREKFQSAARCSMRQPPVCTDRAVQLNVNPHARSWRVQGVVAWRRRPAQRPDAGAVPHRCRQRCRRVPAPPGHPQNALCIPLVRGSCFLLCTPPPVSSPLPAPAPQRALLTFSMTCLDSPHLTTFSSLPTSLSIAPSALSPALAITFSMYR